MEISTKSHGKKSDKETQSPMLKIFKDIMQKDNIESEKITLLKDKKRDKKKKSYSESRSKSDPRTYDSSSTDRYKTNKQANITVQDILEDKENYGYNRSRSDAFRGDKKESWWFWTDFKKKQEARREQKRTEDDTCSCVSCALKKIIGSECTCVCLLVLLFSVSVVIAFLLIFKNEAPCDMKQQIKRQLPEGYGTERTKWDRQLNSLDSISDMLENKGNSYKRSYLDDVNAELSGELASVLDTQKMDSQISQKLRDFFNKLVQTDIQIKRLKQDVNRYYQNENLNSFTVRYKRSLKDRFNKRHFRAIKGKNIKSNAKRNIMNNKKRSLKTNSNLTGYLIEKEKVVIHYEPGRKRNFPKCFHSHETKSHEKKLKHPFYKHSQRIDEMLRYKKPEIGTKKSSKPTTDEMKLIDYKEFDDKNDNVYTENADIYMNVKTEKETSFDLETFLSTTPLYDVAHSVSTSINPLDDRSNTKTTYISTNNHIGYRKLMEADDEDDEEVNYEDLKEVLTDDHQDHDDVDRTMERKKRDNTDQFDLNHYKYFPSQILNPNWKGPMPFYPDELNTMIKQAAIQHFNIQLPVTTKETRSDRDRIEKDVSDTQYIEDYSDNKMNKMVKMAQAYSDYGVVYNKKNDDIKDKIVKPDSRFKQSLEKRFFKNNIFSTSTLVCPSEGIRFEYRPGNIKNEHEELIKDISKHIKIVKHPMHEGHSTTLRPVSEDFQNIYSTSHINIPVTNAETMKSAKTNKNIIFAIRKGSRSLKSIDIADESQEKNSHNSSGSDQNDKNNTSKFDDVFRFLAVLGDWFRTMSNLSGESNISNENINLNNITQMNSTKQDNKMLVPNNTSDVLYPSDDLDLVDNIGHRSRVLLSVVENNNNDENFYTKNDSYSTKSSSQSDSDSIVPIALVLAANTPNISKENVTNKYDNRTSIVKRSIDGNKLVFWNGIYDDDEYGIKLDYTDNVREKHLVNDRNVMQKSKDWIQGKFKNITCKIKGKWKKKIKNKTTNKKSVERDKTKVKPKIEPSKPKIRNIRNSNENPDVLMKKNFAILTANMKKVCQQAVKAIQNTKNIEARDDNKEGAAATSLMQQLVQLMTDVVDIQVQQKTCAKLPSDLQNFLEWLTAPADSNIRVDDLTAGIPDYVAVDDAFARIDKSTISDVLTTLSEDIHQDDRTECLGTIRAVQDLIQQYEGMNNDDKSKMNGVKEYLENQLNFLNKKLIKLDDASLYKLYEKRELPRMKRNSKDKLNKFVKNFSKKHTKTTSNDYITENYGKKNILNKDYRDVNNDLIDRIINEKLNKVDNKKL